MKLRTASLLLALLLLLPMLFACTKKNDEIRVYTLNGTTGFGMAKLMDDNANKTLAQNYSFTVKADVSDVTAALINGDADIAALPTNAAANLYAKTNGEVQILAVNTLGCLYLLTNENASIKSFADLEGKTVYVPAQNPTFIFTYLCKQNGLINGQNITIDSTSYAAAANLRDALASGLVDIAVLPEPMVTIAKSAAKQNARTLTTALDLTAEWNKVTTPGSLVQGCVVVRTDFLNQNPKAVEAFLKSYEASIAYLTSNTDSAAAMIEKHGIFTKAAIAKQAIPKCNVCYLDGAEMKAAMQNYLKILYNLKPESVGGSLPDDGFYYNAK